jgi:predicted Rossmann fold nucleotide-binding protein DprA/Smf involved in DNA uptake
VVVVSEFLPGIPWSVHNAMQRNSTICGLSHAMILIEARASGGSMAAGKASLELGVPIFAAVYDGMPESAEGNRELLALGARRLLKSGRTGRANINPVLRAVARSQSQLQRQEDWAPNGNGGYQISAFE